MECMCLIFFIQEDSWDRGIPRINTIFQKDRHTLAYDKVSHTFLFIEEACNNAYLNESLEMSLRAGASERSSSSIRSQGTIRSGGLTSVTMGSCGT